MIVGGTHESLDEPPPVPMFGAQRPRGRPSTGNLADALTDVADKITNALSPPTSQPRNLSGNYSQSPSKSVELRGKYIQQLKEMVNLRDIGALTAEEYEEQRSVVVNLMRKLSSTSTVTLYITHISLIYTHNDTCMVCNDLYNNQYIS